MIHSDAMPRRRDKLSISLSFVLLLGACATQPDDAADDTSTSTSDCAGDACCSPNCFVDGTVDGSSTCPNADAGEVCDPWSLGDMADPCYENVGVCSTPP